MSKDNREKTVNKNGASQIIVKSVKGQIISDREVYAMNNNEVEGLLAVEVVRKGNAFRLIYHLTGLISLRNFLLTPMDRQVFVRLIQSILKIMNGLRKAHFNEKALDMNLDKVMVNPVKQQLLFMYLPIQGYDSGSSLRTFLLEIIQSGRFIKEDDSNYVQKYISILKEGINLSIFELEEYVENLISGKGYDADQWTLCYRCGAQIDKNARFCPICGTKISGIQEKEWEKKTYDPSGTSEEDRKDRPSDCSRQEKPFLIREKTSEKITIDKEEFCIGRSSWYCDYVVEDNMMIGRRHAVIICVGGRYFIEDLHSTNKTYVNEQSIEKQEIISGTRIRLADEYFVFYGNV